MRRREFITFLGGAAVAPRIRVRLSGRPGRRMNVPGWHSTAVPALTRMADTTSCSRSPSRGADAKRHCAGDR